MSKSATVSQYSEVAANLPEDAFLGQIILFTISDCDVQLDRMRALLAALSLNPDRLKKKIRPIDAFKRATKDIECRFPQAASERHALLVRPVGHDSAESHRHVIFERAIYRTGRPREVLHQTVFKLMYDRGERQRDGTIVHDGIYAEAQPLDRSLLSTDEEKWLDEQIGYDGRNLRARFEHYCTHLDSNAIRTFLRDYLTGLDAINVKGSGGGGVYFVQQKHAAELHSLTELVIGIGSHMHTIPLLDIVYQRDMLADAFVADTLEELRQLSAEMSKILVDDSRTITEETYDAYTAQAGKLMARAAEYEELLGRSLDTATFELDMFKQKTLNLATRIRKPKSLGGGV